MADAKLTALAALTSPTDDDLLYIVDVSDTTDDTTSSSRRISRTALFTGRLKLLTANTTLYVATTGSDTTGVGSSSDPWATLTKALTYLNDLWIRPAANTLGNGNGYNDTAA